MTLQSSEIKEISVVGDFRHGALARIIHEGFVNNPGLPDEQPFPPAAGGYVVVGGPGTHPPGWVRCHRAPATTDPSRTADHTGFYLARIVRELCSRIMRARHWYCRLLRGALSTRGIAARFGRRTLGVIR